MDSDLHEILRYQKLSEEQIQFLLYQLLRGLKVSENFSQVFLFNLQTNSISKFYLSVVKIYKSKLICDFITERIVCKEMIVITKTIILLQYIHSAGIIHRVRSKIFIFYTA